MIRVSLILALLLCLVLCAYGSSDNLKSLSPQMTMRQNRLRRRRRRAFRGFAELNRRQLSRFRPRRRRCRAVARSQFRTLSGYCNNLRRPAQGSALETLLALTTPLRRPFNPKLSPNPRFVSNQVHAEETQIPNSRSLSELVTFFGQLIDHTVTLVPVNTQDPANINIPMPDPAFTERQYIPFFRSQKRNDRPINQLTSYIDAASVYGVDPERTEELRTGPDGLLPDGLLNLPGNLLPKNNESQFEAGDERVNENGNLITMHTIWAREHNRVAREIKEAFGSSLNGEQIFQLARHTVAAEMQAVVYYEFLPALTGKRSLPPFRRYNPNVRAIVTNEFSTVGFRMGHTLLNSRVTAIQANGQVNSIMLRESFFNVEQFENQGLDNLLRGMINIKASEVDCGITNEVRNFLIDETEREVELDLAALNIQRGRDHGIPVCNTVRRRFGLPPLRSFRDITKDRTARTNLKLAFGRGNAGKVDAWTCGVCEDHVRGSSLGPLFQAIVLDQFRRLRDGDRFYFENPRYFRPIQIRRVATIRRLVRGRGNRVGQIMRLIIADNSELSLADVPLNPFIVS